jgi:hypothetical protein
MERIETDRNQEQNTATEQELQIHRIRIDIGISEDVTACETHQFIIPNKIQTNLRRQKEQHNKDILN